MTDKQTLQDRLRTIAHDYTREAADHIDKLEALQKDHDDLVINQAWIILSHVASRLDVGDDDLMEKWQDASANGDVEKGFLSYSRGVAAWIARECNKFIVEAKAQPSPQTPEKTND